ncbi:hypothetical protein SSS_02131 [Sarcoptes scabiei]|nr:hypothetical protein SSS_02131 [Sarcoptes scabiei]
MVVSETEMKLRFDGRVAIVTGAARGLGREYSILLASRGASVVVNDLGGSRDGTGESFAADEVVKEIIRNGGTAVADYNSVENGERIVQTAIDNFGRIDIVINNAGILRDKSIMKMTMEDFELVHRVHLKGSFLVTKAAWPYFRQQHFGRIVMTSSPSGLYGNFGQSNYSSAKLALLSLAKTLAIEGDKYDIRCNTIVPVAASRLTEDLLPDEMLDLFQPRCVAPIVCYLCHQTCPANGEVFEAAGGYYGKYLWIRSRGKVFSDPNNVTLEDVRKCWNEITDMSNYSSPSSIENHSMTLIKQLKHFDDVDNHQDLEYRISSNSDAFDTFPIYLTVDDAILYSLSVGVSPKETSNLRYLYENDDNFTWLPTMATTLSLNIIYESAILLEAIERFNLEDNLYRTLHGEQYLKVHRKISLPCQLYCQRPKIIDVLDKGSGALIIIEVSTFDSENRLVFYNQMSFFMIGSGNFGGNRRRSSSTTIRSLSTLLKLQNVCQIQVYVNKHLQNRQHCLDFVEIKILFTSMIVSLQQQVFNNQYCTVYVFLDSLLVIFYRSMLTTTQIILVQSKQDLLAL